MTHEEITIKAQKRVPGLAKSAIKALRKSGQIPAVLYGKKTSATEIQVDIKSLPKTGHTRQQVIALDLDGKKSNVLMREVQFDTLKDNILHMDLQEVGPDESVFVNVPLTFTGLTREQEKEGRFRVLRRSIRVKCAVKAIPADGFTIDVSHLKLEDSAYVSDLKLPEGVRINSQGNVALATLAKP
jgi:large subunit ribosomal protein L25